MSSHTIKNKRYFLSTLLGSGEVHAVVQNDRWVYAELVDLEMHPWSDHSFTATFRSLLDQKLVVIRDYSRFRPLVVGLDDLTMQFMFVGCAIDIYDFEKTDKGPRLDDLKNASLGICTNISIRDKAIVANVGGSSMLFAKQHFYRIGLHSYCFGRPAMTTDDKAYEELRRNWTDVAGW